MNTVASFNASAPHAGARSIPEARPYRTTKSAEIPEKNTAQAIPGKIASAQITPIISTARLGNRRILAPTWEHAQQQEMPIRLDTERTHHQIRSATSLLMEGGRAGRAGHHAVTWRGCTDIQGHSRSRSWRRTVSDESRAADGFSVPEPRLALVVASVLEGDVCGKKSASRRASAFYPWSKLAYIHSFWLHLLLAKTAPLY
ncbi:hypothetical protein BU17DRAFT_67104 [Hysterangium stoloniferum]|nr:hypothetical protein BU17DRAFT_67104 [Hysterangium stoloniferum]